MSAVWVVRDVDGMVRHVTLNHDDAMDHAEDDGDTITRETFLTPEMAAVLEAAKQLRDADDASVAAYEAREDVEWARGMAATHDAWINAKGKLFAAVATLRAQEGA